MSTEREELARVIGDNRYWTKMMSDGYLSSGSSDDEEIADAILAAGFHRYTKEDLADQIEVLIDEYESLEADPNFNHTPDPNRNTYIGTWYPRGDVLEVALHYGFYLTAQCGLWLSPKEQRAMLDEPMCEACARYPV